MVGTQTLLGTAFEVDSTWYVRHQGGQGVLLPIEATSALKSALISGHAYEFKGRLQLDHRGYATAAQIVAAQPIGNAPDQKA